MVDLLVIEDDESTRTLYAHALQRFGGIDHASRLDEALRSVDTKRYDAILIDVHLRGRDGLRVLEHLVDGHLNALTPIFVITSDPSVGTRLRALRKASFFVQKPVRVPLLVTLVAGVLKLDPRAGAPTVSPGAGQHDGTASGAHPPPSGSPPRAPQTPRLSVPQRLLSSLGGLWRSAANRIP